MTWNCRWIGTATDFMPDLLKMNGKPGPLADATKHGLWEAVQQLGERSASQRVEIQAQGWEDKEPGQGQVTIVIRAMGPETPIQEKITAQQPVPLDQP